jgi:hypothetical protein
VWLLVMALGQAGCTSARSPRSVHVAANASPPLTVLGTIGVISTSTVPNFTVQEPLSRAEAGELTARRIVFLGGDDFTDDSSMVVSQLTLGLSTLALCVVAVPSRAVAEGLSVPEKSLAEANATMAAAVSKLNLQDELRTRVTQHIEARTSIPIKLVQKPFPPGREKEFSRMSCVMAGTLAWLPRGRSAAEYLAEQGVDTALELQLIHPGLKGAGKINPSLALTMDVRARLLEACSGRELWQGTAQYRSTKHKFTEWAEDDALLFQRELDRCFTAIASQLAAQLADRSGELASPQGVEIARH